MKLNEIINTVTDYSMEKAFPHKLLTPKSSGFFSRVYEKDPWSVKKVLDDKDYDDPKDPYTFYISFLIENHIMERNPFFPRVYNVTKTYNKPLDSRYQYSFQIEKLEHIYTLPRNAIIAATANMTGETDHPYNEDSYRTIIEDSLKYSIPEFVKNKKFIEAVKILKHIQRDYENIFDGEEEMRWDISKDNIMVRLGKFGPQIVFSDPVY